MFQTRRSQHIQRTHLPVIESACRSAARVMNGWDIDVLMPGCSRMDLHAFLIDKSEMMMRIQGGTSGLARAVGFTQACCQMLARQRPQAQVMVALFDRIPQSAVEFMSVRAIPNLASAVTDALCVYQFAPFGGLSNIGNAMIHILQERCFAPEPVHAIVISDGLRLDAADDFESISSLWQDQRYTISGVGLAGPGANPHALRSYVSREDHGRLRYLELPCFDGAINPTTHLMSWMRTMGRNLGRLLDKPNFLP